MERIKFLLAAVIPGIALIVILWLWLRSDFEARTEHYIIHMPAIRDSLHVQVRRWGLGYNHRELLLSARFPGQALRYDSAADYRFFGVAPFYYRAHADTLTVYLKSASGTPPAFPKNITVIEHTLSDKEREQLRSRYTEFDLMLIE